MDLDELKARILSIVGERGPVDDATIAGQLVERWDAAEIVPHTAELQRMGLIEQPESAPEGWQVTHEGRRALAGAGGG